MITARISNFKDLERELRVKVKRVPKVVAVEAKEILRDNSAESKDIRGRKLPPYSKGYASFRRRHGLSTTPDQRFTGNLLDNAKIEVAEGRSSVRPDSPDMHKAVALHEKRRLYPDDEADFSKHEKRIAAAGERAMSD